MFSKMNTQSHTLPTDAVPYMADYYAALGKFNKEMAAINAKRPSVSRFLADAYLSGTFIESALSFPPFCLCGFLRFLRRDILHHHYMSRNAPYRHPIPSHPIIFEND